MNSKKKCLFAAIIGSLLFFAICLSGCVIRNISPDEANSYLNNKYNKTFVYEKECSTTMFDSYREFSFKDEQGNNVLVRCHSRGLLEDNYQAKLYDNDIANIIYNKYQCSVLNTVGYVYETSQYYKVCKCLDKWPDGNGFDSESKKQIYDFRYDILENGGTELKATTNPDTIKRVPVTVDVLQQDFIKISNGEIK